MKILLLGGTGLLGSEFAKIFSKQNIHHLVPSQTEIDVKNPEQTRIKIKQINPDLIIWCVGYTAVDQAEINRDKCWELNVSALKNILQCDIPICHFSTDYVFAGKENREEDEDSPVQAVNYYGQSKIAAEKLLAQHTNLWWNIRTSWLIGSGGNNFVSKILSQVKQDKKLSIVNDQYGRPTMSKVLAEYTWENILHPKIQSGHYHAQGSGKIVSWADLARWCLQRLKIKHQIKEITSAEMDSLAKRPTYSLLKNTKLSPPMPDWQIDLAKWLDNSSQIKQYR